MKSMKLENLEKKLGVASNIVQTLSTELELIEIPEITDIAVVEEEVFNLQSLKTDFGLIRSNILKLVNSGQRTLDTASIIDVSDMKASTIQALATLQIAIGGNLNMLMNCYKTITEIEKLRIKEKKMDATSNVNMGTVVNNQILFSGDTNKLLDLIRTNQNT